MGAGASLENAAAAAAATSASQTSAVESAAQIPATLSQLAVLDTLARGEDAAVLDSVAKLYIERHEVFEKAFDNVKQRAEKLKNANASLITTVKDSTATSQPELQIFCRSLSPL